MAQVTVSSSEETKAANGLTLVTWGDPENCAIPLPFGIQLRLDKTEAAKLGLQLLRFSTGV